MRWLWSLSAGITTIRDPHPEFDRGASLKISPKITTC